MKEIGRPSQESSCIAASDDDQAQNGADNQNEIQDVLDELKAGHDSKDEVV